jgi:hypothetical protein
LGDAVKKWILGGLLAVASVWFVLPAQAQMALPGKFEVTDSGSASYTIPISIVPGTAGLEPKLSLQYDSRGGNGLLGIGWSLAGLPAITRCGRTIAQDGQVGGVAFDANDRFCLDGQRLIATIGTYGADQTEYRTERESFSKVVSYGTAGSGPSWFRVWTKAGLVMEFGNTADSKIEAQGKSSVRVWALNKTSDTKGNYFTVSYTEDNANGGYVPNRIDYTGNGSTAPANSVRFVYEARTEVSDLTPAYHAGSRIQTTQRMTKVQAWQGSNQVREYRLGYEISPSTKRSRITSVTQCDASNNCLPASGFAWSDMAIPFTYNAGAANAFTKVFHQVGAANGPFWMTEAHPTFPIDVNGDGRTDFLQIGKTTDVAQVLKSNGDGTYTQILNQTVAATPFRQTDSNPTFFADVDGDGLTDVIQIAKTAVSSQVAAQVLKSNGDGSFTQIYSNAASPFWAGDDTVTVTYTLDYDGDGRTDFIQIEKNNAVAQVLHSNGDGTYTRTFHQTSSASGPFRSGASGMLHMADFNGDGRSDILVQAIGGYFGFMLTSNGDGTFTQAWAQGEGSNYPIWGTQAAQLYIVDINGDGTPDFLQVANAGHHAHGQRYNGDATFTNTFTQANTNGDFRGAGWVTTYPVDYNMDGKTDILQIAWASFTAPIMPSVGNDAYVSGSTGAYTQIAYQGSTADGPFLDTNSYLTFPVDVNGDGRTDIVQIGKVVPNAQVILPSGDIPDQMRTITGGQGAVTDVVYAPLVSNGALYTRDSGASKAVWPMQDVAGPIYVVSEVKSSNGINATPYRSTYRYAGAKSDLLGRGFLGFRQMTVRDEQTGVEQVTTNRQDYPFTGLVASREKKLGAQLLNRSSNSYDATNLGGTRRYPFLTQSLEESWELTGAALPAVTTAYQYDAYGNATQVGVSTGDGYSKTTVNTYSNDAANWLLGRLTRSEVTSATPGN